MFSVILILSGTFMTRYNYNTDQSERVYVNRTTILLLLKSLCEMSTPTCITDVSGCREVNVLRWL